MNSRQGMRPMLRMARLLRRPSTAAPSTVMRRCIAVKAGTSRPAPKVTANPRFNPTLAPSIPRFGDALKFTPCSLMEFKESAQRMEIEQDEVPGLYSIYLVYHDAVQDAAVTKNTKWEDAFFAQSNATPQSLYDAASIACGIRNGQQTHPERLLFMHMLDTAGEKGIALAATSLVLSLTDMGDWTTAKNIYPRAVPRLRNLRRNNNKSHNFWVVMGVVEAREGRDTEAIEHFQTARRLAAASPDVKFDTEAICALELGKLLVKKGDRTAALVVLQQALKYDTREICYEVASLLGETDHVRYRRLMTKSAITGYVPAIKAMAALEAKMYETTLASGDRNGMAPRLLAEALEWERLLKAWGAKPEDAARHF